MLQERMIAESRWNDERDRIHIYRKSPSEAQATARNGDIDSDGQNQNEPRSSSESTSASECNMVRIMDRTTTTQHSYSKIDYGMSSGFAGITGYAGRYNEEFEGYGYAEDEEYFPDRYHAPGGHEEGYAEIAFPEEYADGSNYTSANAERALLHGRTIAYTGE
ncbi:hypothetical protein ACMFMG_009698 [Clarireedia jacksonii]